MSSPVEYLRLTKVVYHCNWSHCSQSARLTWHCLLCTLYSIMWEVWELERVIRHFLIVKVKRWTTKEFPGPVGWPVLHVRLLRRRQRRTAFCELILHSRPWNERTRSRVSVGWSWGGFTTPCLS